MKFIKTLLSFAVVASYTGLSAPSVPALPNRAVKPRGVGTVTTQRPVLEMVFVLDTTGSMGGLLEGAKQRIWGIVNEVMASPTRPDVKIGLVAYRDHGDAYVTQVLPITRDLDKVYSTLMELRAEGGGDGPEDVRQALADGVRKAHWSPRSPRIAQILFLVGDAPPHDDYKQEIPCFSTTATAVGKGLVVNTIQCGDQSDTRLVWQEIARQGEGRYFAIAQDGGVAAVTTPYDKELAQLGAKIGSTYTAYGAAPARSRAKNSAGATELHVSAAAPASAQADRAVNKAINRYAYEGDLLQDIENGAVKSEAIKDSELPDDLKKLSPEIRKKEIARRIEQRKTLRAEILTLSRQRDTFLRGRQKKSDGKPVAFDTAVADALRKQAAKKHIRL